MDRFSPERAEPRVGRIYQQTFVDTYPRVAICKLYTEKTAITAADLLNDRVIPFFAEHEISLLRVLTELTLARHWSERQW